jgi:CRP/FNR family transcriptional regulator, cyclic AMP receptor protein
MISDATAVLSGSPFFQEFLPRHLDKLLGLGSEIHFAKDQIIFPEGDESPIFYVIVSGRVALESGNESRSYRIQILYPGEELGWSSVLGRKKQFQARALEPVEALAFEVPALREACASNPYFGAAFFERLLTVVAERLQITRAQLTAVLAGQSGEAAANRAE